MNILIGADPEVFVRKDGQFISAHGIIEGDKKNPQPVNNGAVQVDGMALEFNINPASSKDEFLYNIEDVMGQLKAMIPQELEVVATPVAEFGYEYIDSQPAEAKELGCDPDRNAWTSRENPKPNGETSFRTAAGHVHIGWTECASKDDSSHTSMAEALVKQLDFFLGLPSLLFDNDVKRREMYGKAGAYRVKPYGCEYRTLSNKWLQDKSLMELVYDNTIAAVHRLMKGDELYKKYGDIQYIINQSDRDIALHILKEEGIAYEI